MPQKNPQELWALGYNNSNNMNFDGGYTTASGLIIIGGGPFKICDALKTNVITGYILIILLCCLFNYVLIPVRFSNSCIMKATKICKQSII